MLLYSEVLFHGKDKLRACLDCGYIHLDPLPDQAALDEFYRGEYYQAHHAGWFEKERREWWYWSAVYQERVRKFERLTEPTRDTFRWIFDWGAGCGWFVKAASLYDPNIAAGSSRRLRCTILT
jgi:hypothetical protein